MLLCKDDTWIDQYLKQYGYSLERQEDQFYAIDSHGQIHLKVGEKIELYGGICPIVVECVPYQKKTQLNILVYEMNKEFPWLGHCLNHFEVTNVGANHDLMQLFDEPFQEPKKV